MKTKKHAVPKAQTMGDFMGKKMPKQMKAPAAAKKPAAPKLKPGKAKKAY